MFLVEKGFEEQSNFFYRSGVAKDRGMRNQCKKRLYFYSTDREMIANVLLECSQANDCFEVKMRKEDRLGIYIGFCIFTNESTLGDVWARYELHPKLLAAVHDDEFCDTFRSRVRSYD
jgi:hypothetical protein